MEKKLLPEIISNIGEEKLRELFLRMKKEQYEIYKDYIATNPPKHLDVGTEDGITALYIKKQNPSVSVDMLDLQDSIVEEVKKCVLIDPLFNHTIYREGDSFPFPNNFFGSISFFYVLHHCKNREESLKVLLEAKRVLNEGGYIFVLEEPAMDEAEKILFKEVDLAVTKVFDPNFSKENYEKEPQFFIEDELTHLFKKAGLKIIKSIKPSIEQNLFPRKIYILKKD